MLGLGASLAGANHARDQWSVGTARELAVRGDAKSLATAALLLRSANSLGASDALHAIDLADRAAQAAPDDNAIGWIHLRICEQTPGCDLPGAATTLRWVDADNAAPWLSMLSAAIRDKDEPAVDHALAGMAAAKRFYLYWNPSPNPEKLPSRNLAGFASNGKSHFWIEKPKDSVPVHKEEPGDGRE